MTNALQQHNHHTPKLISGLEALIDLYDHFVLDIWGVLHDGLQHYPYVIPALEMLKAEGKQIALLSNSPNRASAVQHDLQGRFGIPSHLYDHILTSGDSSFQALEDHASANVYCMWDDEDPTCLEGAPVTRVADIHQAGLVLASLFPHTAQHTDYDPILEHMLARDLTMICANADLVVNIGTDLVLCAGTIAQEYETRGGRVSWHGKPHNDIYTRLHQMMGKPHKKTICAIGDSLRTDIQGAGHFGIDVVWNVVGIHAADIIQNDRINNDAVQAEISQWVYAPTFMMNGLTP